METQVSVSSVSERDIDLLLLEEFVASKEFGSWFVCEACSDTAQLEKCVFARRSVTQSIGESDLELTFLHPDGRCLLVMVENKVTAAFQARQADRYRQRGKGYVESGQCDHFLTILTAPEAYFGPSKCCKGFDGRVSYESILRWFQSAGDLGERLSYKTALLQAAITKSSLGYQPVEDSVTTLFWKGYWQLVRHHASELRMREPGAKPSGSTFVYFEPAGLVTGATIVHKLTGTKGASTGFVDLQLPGLGKDVLALDNALQHLLEKGMSIVQVSKSAAIRLVVPSVDPNRDTDSQTQAMKDGVFAARRLVNWFQSNANIRTEIDILTQRTNPS